jgi:hypothetical protein
MTEEEAIEILEGIAKDPDVNPTARVTAIRALLGLAPEEPKSGIFAELDKAMPRRSRRKQAKNN